MYAPLARNIEAGLSDRGNERNQRTAERRRLQRDPESLTLSAEVAGERRRS